jgi:thioredoxin reductase (NADPH)
VEAVEYRVGAAAKTRVVKADAVFVRVGWDPRTELLRGQLRLDRDGYIRAGVAGITSVPGVYAAGDVCSHLWPSIANATGQGATAAWEITRKLGKVG